MRAAWFLVICMIWLTGTALAGSGQGRLVTQVEGKIVDVPLEHTDVKIRVDGPVAEATVTQRYRNPSATKIEAVYLFPLPTGAAVNGFVLTSGERRIRGSIHERAKAKAIYEAARSKGLVAALLTQERPNLFTQSIANLEPANTIEVTLTYVQRLDYDDGGYALVFPMVVGPRYLPEKWKAKAPELQAPTLPPGLRSSHDIALSVELDAGVAIEDLGSPSHQIATTRKGRQASIRIQPGDTIPNKDFILRYKLAGAIPKVGVVAHRDGKQGSFLLMVQPPAAAAPDMITPREIIFVLDTSSSMRGASLAKAKELIRRMLWTLRPDDTFQIVRFADRSSALGPGPIAAKPANVEYVLKWLGTLEAGGGTELTTGVAAALAVPHDPLRLRILAFITDGYVGNEDEILAAVGKQIGTSRLFSFGVGTAVNRYLLEEMAAIGRGSVQFVRPDEDTSRAVSAFERRIDAPVLTDLKIDWGGLAAKDITPSAIPDVFVGQPLVLSGHYAVPGTGVITVSGKHGNRPVAFSIPVHFPDKAARPAIATLWARARIAELSRGLIRKHDPAIERSIIGLSLEHRILTQYTAFVAVDESKVTAGGEAKRVVVPVEVPDAARQVASGSSEGYGFGSAMTMGYGSGYGVGSSASYGVMGARVAAPIVEVRIAQPMVSGNLDAAIVRRYIKRHLAKFTYCYEKRLLAKPALEGTITTKFVIGATGAVMAAEATGMDAEVSSCVASVLKAIEFPAAKDGGTIQVNYPFNFIRSPTAPTFPSRQDAIQELFK
jgi:Ca-activated chloride channel family protein